MASLGLSDGSTEVMPLEDKKKFTGDLKASIANHPRALLAMQRRKNEHKFRVVKVPEGCIAFMKASTSGSTPLAERGDSTIHRTGKTAARPRHGLALGFKIKQAASKILKFNVLLEQAVTFNVCLCSFNISFK